LRYHPLRGAIFESWVSTEILKHYTNQGKTPSLYHYRESRGLEIDILIEAADTLQLVEVKSGSTIIPSFFKNLKRFSQNSKENFKIQSSLVYAGEESYKQAGIQLISWRELPTELERWNM